MRVHDFTVDDLVELLSTVPAKSAQVTVNFVEAFAEPLLGGLEKDIDPLEVVYPAREHVDQIGLSCNSPTSHLELKSAIITAVSKVVLEVVVDLLD